MKSNTLKGEKKSPPAARDSFCIYPFKSINIMPAGNIKPCCAFGGAIQKDNRDMSIYEYPLEDIWDSSVMRDVRHAMTEEEPVAGCEYCYGQERQGLTSMRKTANGLWNSRFLNEAGETVDELKARVKDQDFRVPSGPEYLDLDVGNLCNLKCRMCNTAYSSGIASDPVHSRWSPTTALARWQGSASIIAPRRVIGVSYEGLGYPDQTISAETAWTNGDAAIRLTLPTIDLVGFSVRLSAEKPDNHPLTIKANGEVLFHGALPTGKWEYRFDWPFPANSGELELRFQSPVFNRQPNNDSVGVGIDEIKLLRSEIGKSAVTISRFPSGKQWFQDYDFLIKELLRNPESIKKLNVIGGEPLLIKEVRQIMRHLVDNDVAKQITLVLTTNGMFADDEWFELAANFKHSYVSVSVDGFGPVSEYIRFPSKWETVAANLRRFRAQPNTDVFVNDTIQAYNVLDIISLVEFCQELDTPFRFHLLSHPAHLSAHILPGDIRQEAARRLRSYLSEKPSHAANSAKTVNGTKIEIANNLQQLISALEAGPLTVDPDAIRDFMMFTNDLDLSRGQNINDTFPELVQRLADDGFPWTSDTKFSKQNLLRGEHSTEAILENSTWSAFNREEKSNMTTEQRHNYEYEFDTTSETAPAHVVRMVGQSKRVLEIGCGPGSITKILAEQGGCQVTGLELDPEAIKKATPYCVQVMQADLNSSDWLNLLDGAERFDVVVAADVLEHLYDPWTTLQRMVPLINTNGYLVISLPHVGHAAVMSCLINGNFEYRDWGLLDRTHIRFFGLKNIEDLFAQANLKIVEANYVTMPPEATEFADGWSKLSPLIQHTLMSCKDSEVYQVVVKAVPLNYGTDAAVPLVSPEHQRPVVVIDRFKQQLDEKNDEINRLNQSLLALHSSTSWRATKPIRLIKIIINSIRGN